MIFILCIFLSAIIPNVNLSGQTLLRIGHCEVVEDRSSTMTRTGSSTGSTTRNCFDKCRDNAMRFVDHEGHSRDLTRCARSPMILTRCHVHNAAFVYTSAFAQQNLLHCIHTAAFTLQHSLNLCSHIHAASMQLHSYRNDYAAALTPAHFLAAFTPQH